MATSTTTLLEVCNRVLLNANERTISDTSTTLVGQQVKECVRSALAHIVKLGEWTWTQAKTNASSWSTNIATLPTTTQRVKNVVWQNATTDGVLLPLHFVSRPIFDRYVLESYSDTTTRPLRYTLLDYNQVAVNPYPTTVDEQNKILFYTNVWVQLPSTDASVFNMPEEFINMVVTGATAMFVKRHMDDLNMARSFEEEFSLELSQARARQFTIPGNSWNLYRGRKISSYGADW